MVGTASLAAVGGSLLFFGGLTAGLVAVFRAVERDAYETTGRRKLARSAFGLGAGSSLLALVGLATTFVLDVESVLGVDPLYAGVGLVVVAAVPLTVGLVLGMDPDAVEG